MAQNRTDKRKELYSDPQRIALLEEDADESDVYHQVIEDKLDTLNKLLIGILITMATGTTFAAASVVTGAFN